MMADPAQRRPRTPDFVVIGQVRRPHGIRGALRVAVMSDDPERFHRLEEIWLNPGDDQRTRFTLTRVQVVPDGVILTVAEIGDRTAAETWRQAWIEIPGEQILPLPEGKHYLFELIGLKVVSEAGEPLGEVIEVMRTPAHDLYVVRGAARDHLIPAVPEFVRQIDSETGIMVVHLVEGLLDL